MNTITLSIFYGLLAMIPIGLANAIAKVPGQKYGSTKLLFLRTIITSTLLLIILLIWHRQTAFSLPYILFALAISVLAYFANLFLYKAMAVGTVGLVGPVASSYAILSILLSVSFLRVHISAIQFAAIIGMVIGSLIISGDRDKGILPTGNKEGLLYAIICAICYGLFFFLAQYPTNIIGANLSGLIFEIGILICASLHLRKQKLDYSFPKADMLIIFLVSALTVLSIWGLYTGLDNGNPGIVLALSSAAPAATVVYGFIAYKERLNYRQYCAIMLIIAGIIVLSTH